MEFGSLHDFWQTHSDQFTWPFLPSRFLYDCYYAWCQSANLAPLYTTQIAFSRAIKKYVHHSTTQWHYQPQARRFYPTYSPLVNQYRLSEWGTHRPPIRCHGFLYRKDDNQ